MTSYPQLAPALWALVFFTVAAAIAGWQSKAAACARHHRFAGWAAWSLAALCGAVGAVLLFSMVAP
jgi:hypothetical protein